MNIIIVSSDNVPPSYVSSCVPHTLKKKNSSTKRIGKEIEEETEICKENHIYI